jgi:hypothetical protein
MHKEIRDLGTNVQIASRDVTIQLRCLFPSLIMKRDSPRKKFFQKEFRELSGSVSAFAWRKFFAHISNGEKSFLLPSLPRVSGVREHSLS